MPLIEGVGGIDLKYKSGGIDFYDNSTGRQKAAVGSGR